MSIADHAFYEMTGVYRLTLNEGLETIGAYAVSHLDRLSSVVIPSTVKEILDHGFASNNALSRITFAPNSQLEIIGNYAFSYVNISSIVIPEIG